MPSFIPVDFDPFEEVKEIQKITPTNEPQREIWLSCIIGGDDANLSYNESVSLKIKGKLNYVAFERAINDLILRHDALRSTISPNGEILITYRDFPANLKLNDIAHLNKPEQEENLKTFLRNVLDLPLDLQNGPLFKVFLHKLSDSEYFFTLLKHHVISDGWSTGVILEDLSKMYNAYCKGENITLGKSSQMSDYISAQTKFNSTDEYKRTEDFWLNLYKDDVPVLDLPTDFPRQSPRTHKGNRIDYPISSEFAREIRKVGAKAGSSLVTTLLTAFEIFLYLKTNCRDIVIGLPAAGQPSSGLPDLVGHCVNLLPLKSKIEEDISFVDYLKKRRGEILDAYEHQRLTFGELIKKLYIPRDLSRVTLVPVIFNIDMGMDQAVSFNGLEYELISNPRAYENFELYLNITGSKNNFILEWSYNSDLFHEATIKSFHDEYLNLLKRVTSNANFKIADLKPEAEQFKPEISAPVHTLIVNTLNELFYNSVKSHRDEIAISFKGVALSYFELNEKANQYAHFLINEHVVPNDHIALIAERSIDMIVALLAIIKTGCAYVPIDVSYPKERIDLVIENVKPKCILISKKFAEKFKDSGYKILFIEDISKASEKFSNIDLHIETRKDSLVYILHTSGSTGTPKGVCMNQNALVNLLLWQKRKSIAGLKTKTLQFSPLGFDVSFQEIFATLTTGGHLVLISEEDRIDPFKVLDILSEQQIERLFLPFVALQSITESASSTHIFPSALKEVMTAGEQLKITPQIVNFFSRIPGSILYNQYGPTEAHVVTELKLFGDPKKWPGLPGIGNAIDNTEIHILDRNLNTLPAGEVGELCISGLCLANEYLNLPELTKEKFTYLPNSEIRIYRTGDLAKLHQDGNIEFLGRSDHQVKIRGYRIELGEIEAHLNRQSGVKQAVVTAQEEKTGEKKLIAYVTIDTPMFDIDESHFTDTTEQSLLSIKDFDAEHYQNSIEILTDSSNNEIIATLKKSLKKSLPEYMVPSELVILNKFPLTNTGKINKKALPFVASSSKDDEVSFIEPRTSAERLISKIWSETLSIDNISIKRNFFELGGHSLLAVKVMIAIEKETKRRLPLATLFENSTIESLAKMIVIDEEEIKWDSLVPIKKTGSKTPIYLIHGGGLNVLVFNPLGKYMDKEQPVYGMQALGLNGKTELLYTMEDLADRYISEIINNDPVGPYALAGYSFGGLLAYEMAKRLLEMGKEVKMLGILDTNAANRDFESTRMQNTIKKIFRQFNKLFFFSKRFLVSPVEVINYQRKTLTKKLNSILGAEIKKELEAFSYENEILNSYDIAYRNYVMKPLDIEVDLFRVKKRVYFLDEPIYLGWKQYAKKGVNVHEVPGDHKTFLFAPNDKEFAEILQKTLDLK